jgi:hypothetical protein
VRSSMKMNMLRELDAVGAPRKRSQTATGTAVPPAYLLVGPWEGLTLDEIEAELREEKAPGATDGDSPT